MREGQEGGRGRKGKGKGKGTGTGHGSMGGSERVTGEWVSRAAVGAGEAHGDVGYCELRVGVGAGATILGEAPRTRLLLMWREGHPCLCQINL